MLKKLNTSQDSQNALRGKPNITLKKTLFNYVSICPFEKKKLIIFCTELGITKNV